MSSNLHNSPSSASNRVRFSRSGFQQIPTEYDAANMNANMSGGGDATIDIPLESMKTNASTVGGGLRNQTTTAAILQSNSNEKGGDSEKRGMFRGRRAKPKAGAGIGRVGYDGEEDTLTAMGKFYTKVFGFSIITRYFLYILPLGILISVPIIVGALLYNDKTGAPAIGGVPIIWLFTWVLIVWCSLWVSKMVAHFLPAIFQVFVGVVSSGVRKYKTVLQKLEIPLSLVGWAVTSLATFKPMMEKNPFNRSHKDAIDSDWVTIVQKLLGAAVVSALVFLAEKFIIQLISINYHRKQFNSRIQESKRHVYILGLLYDASRTLFPMYCHEFAEEDYAISNQIDIKFGGKKHGHKRSGSATPMKILHNIGRVGDQVTSAFGNVAHEITGREVFNPNSSHSIVVEALEKKRTSEALARRIWMSLVVEGREALLEEDIIEVLGTDRKIEAEEAYWALDRDGNGDISLDEMIMTVTEWSRERKSMAQGMVDVASAINVLDGLLCTVVLVAVVFIIIAFLNTTFVTTLATAGTALLSLSFVFSVTAQEFLGSCIFLFVKHPFDVGDRVDIANDYFIVEHISLLFTVFRHARGVKVGQLCQYPNLVLNTLAVDNISRSKSMTEQIVLDIAFGTTFDDIQILKKELEKFVLDKENSHDFLPEVEVEILGTADMSKLSLQVDVQHKSNWANESLRAARRSKFMCALVAALRAVPINAPGGGGDAAGSAANPNYSVAISDSEAKENAEHSAESKEKARLIPKAKLEEAKAANALSPIAPSARGGFSFNENKPDFTSRDPTRDEAWATGRDDTSTLDGRPSIEAELNDVRGLLRRTSTQGKRKPGAEPSRYQQSSAIPTIREPQPPTPYAPGYENQRPVYSTIPSQYQTTQQIPASQHLGVNPFRSRAEEGEEGEEGDDGFGNARPYSGV